MKFVNRLMSFMSGRNGFDRYGRFLFFVYFILVIVQWIVSIFVPQIVSLIMSVLLTLLAIYIFFRIFSKNLVKRSSENYKYIQIETKVKGYFSLQKSKHRDRKTHIYKKCPKCRAVLRLKRIKGKHRAVCPRCGNSFDVKV